MIEHAKTQTILNWFERICQIPRGSKNERAISDWLVAWAEEHGFAARRDSVLNVVIEVPGSPGYEGAPAVVIQGHMDMVCEKTKGSAHDFSKDPIKLVVDGDWFKADGTTLGADNGIALAMALTAATDPDLPHPPLELLFTVDEETGLTGAKFLKPGFIKGKLLLNVDSEDEGVFTVGCAGGRDTNITLPVRLEAAPRGHQAFVLAVGGFKGGHSGVDIHKQRGNAVRTLGRALSAVLEQADARIASLHGGSAHNAIPRDAEALLYLPKAKVAAVKRALTKLQSALRAEHARTDPDVKVTLKSQPKAEATPWAARSTARAVDLLLALPHGVDAYSADIEKLVETSNNLATVRTEKRALVVHTSQRSSVMDKLAFLTHRIEAIARLAGAEAETGAGYPSWQPNMESPLLARCKTLYKNLFQKDPVVEIIHAGLECGIIGARYKGMDMISFGPTIKNPHSPDERIEVRSIGLVWDFFAALLKELK
ncbi:MAG: aminoacyl-histidine dipeptidase [Planctomycetes bacterium]|nr:aminoacyl-histidine dipeptidase [Planctomycetota bacterium]